MTDTIAAAVLHEVLVHSLTPEEYGAVYGDGPDVGAQDVIARLRAMGPRATAAEAPAPADHLERAARNHALYGRRLGRAVTAAQAAAARAREAAGEAAAGREDGATGIPGAWTAAAEAWDAAAGALTGDPVLGPGVYLRERPADWPPHPGGGHQARPGGSMPQRPVCPPSAARAPQAADRPANTVAAITIVAAQRDEQRARAERAEQALAATLAAANQAERSILAARRVLALVGDEPGNDQAAALATLRTLLGRRPDEDGPSPLPTAPAAGFGPADAALDKAWPALRAAALAARGGGELTIRVAPDGDQWTACVANPNEAGSGSCCREPTPADAVLALLRFSRRLFGRSADLAASDELRAGIGRAIAELHLAGVPGWQGDDGLLAGVRALVAERDRLAEADRLRAEADDA